MVSMWTAAYSPLDRAKTQAPCEGVVVRVVMTDVGDIRMVVGQGGFDLVEEGDIGRLVGLWVVEAAMSRRGFL